MSLIEQERAIKLYNEACDMLEGNHDSAQRISTSTIVDLLQASVDILSEVHAAASTLPGATSCVVQARASILLGQLIEWQEPDAAMKNYRDAIKADASNPEAYVQLARSIWKQATSVSELEEVEEILREAIILCDQANKPPDDDEESIADPTLTEANNLLARLLSQSPGRESETREFLASIGYKYTLSNWLTSFSAVPSDDVTLCSGRATSQRLRISNVCAFDDALAPDVLQYMQRTFASDSPFWPEHGYDSPTSGFFSYQLPLVPPAQREPAALNTFESVVHSIWDTARRGMPKLKNAKFAEWWCHSRPHCNGHKLHYDFVTDDGTSPRFPIASTVAFITAGKMDYKPGYFST